MFQKINKKHLFKKKKKKKLFKGVEDESTAWWNNQALESTAWWNNQALESTAWRNNQAENWKMQTTSFACEDQAIYLYF